MVRPHAESQSVEKIEDRRERLFESALEAEGNMKDRLKSVQSELEELWALGLDIQPRRDVTETG